MGFLDHGFLEDEERGSLAPFIAAAAVFALVVVGVAVFTLTRGDGLTEEQRVGRAAVGQNDALQRQNYADYQRYTCSAAQGTEPNMLGAQQESVRQHGARYVDDVTDVTIDGDRATATVKYHYEKDPNGSDVSKRQASTPLTFARQDGQWKVCSAYR
jgi:hypothetical protein